MPMNAIAIVFQAAIDLTLLEVSFAIIYIGILVAKVIVKSE